MKTKLKLLKLLFTIFISTNLLAQDWTTSIEFPNTFNDVYFVDQNTAYACNSSYDGTGGHIKKTTDGGITWEEQFSGIASANMKSIGSPNNGSDVFVLGTDGYLIHTNDGGVNWNIITTSIGTIPMEDIYFLSETVGYIAAREAKILKTTDGGMNWVDINAVIPEVDQINQIWFLDENVGFIAGINFFRKTTDGGLNWVDVPGFENTAGTLYQIQEIQFLDDQVGYISGDLRLFFKTTDGGNTWIDKQVITADPDVSIFDFKFLDSSPEIGFACGYHGNIMRTYDGGDNWELMTTDVAGTNMPDGKAFHALDFFEDKGIMVAWGGEMLTYQDGPGVSVTDIDKASLSIYPNPVTNTIHFSGFENEISEVQIININGKIVKTILDPSNNQIACHDLISGTYIIKLITQEKILTKLFVKK